MGAYGQAVQASASSEIDAVGNGIDSEVGRLSGRGEPANMMKFHCDRCGDEAKSAGVVGITINGNTTTLELCRGCLNDIERTLSNVPAREAPRS